MKHKIIFILLLSVGLPSFVLSQKYFPPISDLDSLYRTLIHNHPKLICGKDREQFDSLYSSIRVSYPAYSENQKILEMAKLVASIHDGHTQMGLAFDTANHFHQLPIKLYCYQNGIFIRRAAEEYGQYSGMKVLKIGSLSIDTIVKRALPFVHGENVSAVKDILPSRIIIPEVLNYIGAISSLDSIPIVLEDSMLKIYNVLLRPVSSSVSLEWVSARNTANSPPLYLQNPNKNYWFTYIDSLQLFYFQFNAVQNMDDNPFEKFIQSMFREIDSLPVSKMVIDVRNNNGGDNTLNKYLIHALIRSDKVNQKGKLFAIIGRLTFSAAVNLTAELESNTNTIFVGEPTAAGPNHYGETKVLHLPESHLIVLYSSQYWQSSFPWDKRTSINPTIPIEMTSIDFRNNQDPCLTAIKEYNIKSR
jgi:hypothetical protein